MEAQAVGTIVATNWVGNAYNPFYSDTAFSQWLDENAAKGFASDDATKGVAVAVGQVLENALLTMTTAGLGSVVTRSSVCDWKGSDNNYWSNLQELEWD